MAKKKIKAEEKATIPHIIPRAALIIGLILLIAGIILTAIAVSPFVKSKNTLNEYSRLLHKRSEPVVNSAYNGHSVIISGTLSYDEAGAVDAIFGVSADAPLLFRISEMYQWAEDGDSCVWSEALIPSPDDAHLNPSEFSSNTKSNSYIAHGCMLGDYTISDELLLLLPEREDLTSLPEVSVRGFRTSGKYITNSDDISNPEIGDIRISYKYTPASDVSFVGKQREAKIVSHKIDDTDFCLAVNGDITKDAVLAHYRSEMKGVIWWLLVISFVMTLAGGALFFDGFARVNEYSPTFELFGEKGAPADDAAYIYGLSLGIASFLLTLTIAFVSLRPVAVVFASALMLGVLYAIGFDMIKHFPRPDDKKAYVPILVRRDDENGKRK